MPVFAEAVGEGARGDTLFLYRGRSMWPLFQDGDVLDVRPLGGAGIRAGDCLVFRPRDGGAPVVHRVARTRPALVTRGDAHAADDDHPLTRARVIGRVVARTRFGHRVGVHGGVVGRLSARLHRLGGRLDPSRATRGGVWGRRLQRTLDPLVGNVVRRRVRAERRPDGGPGALLTLGGRVVGLAAWPDEGDTLMRVAEVTTMWPWTLAVGRLRDSADVDAGTERPYDKSARSD